MDCVMHRFVRHHSLDFGDRDHRQEPAEGQEQRQEQTEGAEERKNVDDRRAEIAPARRQEVAVE